MLAVHFAMTGLVIFLSGLSVLLDMNHLHGCVEALKRQLGLTALSLQELQSRLHTHSHGDSLGRSTLLLHIHPRVMLGHGLVRVADH